MCGIGSPQVEEVVSTERKSFSSHKARMMAAMLAMGAAAFFSEGPTLARSEGLQSVAAPIPALPNSSPGLIPGSFADLVERVSPAVVSVHVDVESSVQPNAMPAFPPSPYRNFRAPRTFSQAAGSGFIVDSSGYIVTNKHVVESARRITITMSDQREFEARLVGADTDTDVALLKVEAINLPTVVLGGDRRLRVGDWVIAVGNPFNLGGTVTAGIVSSIGRDIGNGPYTDYIQIDAPINRGNSGGPTFDISGRVVGMNTAIFSPSGGSVGIGFAVSASTIQNVVDQLKTTGSVDRGWLGVQIQDITPELPSSLRSSDVRGAVVADVVVGSPAQRAGFVPGDVVVALNGINVADSKALTRQVATLKAGQTASFTVLRNGTRHTLTATIQKRDLSG